MRRENTFSIGELKVGVWSITASIIITFAVLLAGATFGPSLGLYEGDLRPPMAGVIDATPLG